MLAAYRARGCIILDQSADQESTDLEKALTVVAGDGRCTRVVLLGAVAGIDGRLDHTFATINALYRFHSALQVDVLATDMLLRLLPTGVHAVEASPGSHCGLV